MRSRSLAFAVLAGLCVVAAIVSAAIAVVANKETVEKGNKLVVAARPDAERIIEGGQPFVAFRTLDRANPANYGRLAVAPLTAEGPGKTVLAGPVCERVTFRASIGMCLARAGATTFPAIQLDADMKEVHRFTIAGVPSRTRISPDGHFAGVTAFLTGHSYAQPGQFSTAATILDLRTGKVVGDLEKDFKVFNDGKLIDARDRNYWGLTFADDGDTFYATRRDRDDEHVADQGLDQGQEGARRSTPTSSALRSRRTGRASATRRPSGTTRRSGASACSTSRPARRPRPPRSGRSTIRWSGSTTSTCCIATARRRGSSTPTAAGNRACG